MSSTSVEDRFWSKVTKNGPWCERLQSNCWQWTARRDRDGYGKFRVGGKTVSAHRYAYSLTNGEIPKGTGYHGTVVRHRCDDPSCVNPAHLETGSTADNNLDCVERGRHVAPRGEQNGQVKLTDDQVAEIRKRYRKGSWPTQRELASEYGCSQTQIGCIVNFKKRRLPTPTPAQERVQKPAPSTFERGAA